MIVNKSLKAFARSARTYVQTRDAFVGAAIKYIRAIRGNEARIGAASAKDIVRTAPFSTFTTTRVSLPSISYANAPRSVFPKIADSGKHHIQLYFGFSFNKRLSSDLAAQQGGVEQQQQQQQNQPVQVTLFQYEACPFCNKVKAYMDFYRVPYRVVEVNPFNKKELEFSKDYKKVPVAIVNGEQVNNSLDIIKDIQKKLEKSGVQFPQQTPEGKAREEKWFNWADEQLAKKLPPNIYSTFGQSFEAFKYISNVPEWSAMNKFFLRASGSIVMRMMRNKMMKKYGMTDVRKDLYATIQEFTNEIGDNKFFGGEQPSAVDIIVFGVFRSVAHLQTGIDVFNTNSKFKEWYDRMAERVGPSSRV